jgi:hypothetical protein
MPPYHAESLCLSPEQHLNLVTEHNLAIVTATQDAVLPPLQRPKANNTASLWCIPR